MGKGKVLVIDDSPIVRKLAEMALVDEGYQVVTAENGEDGLRLAEEILPSVILVDFIMPRMSGYQFCQLLRENQTLKDIPIILITAKGDDVGRKFSERFAVSDYFIKPFKSEALVDKVNSIVLGESAEAKEAAVFEPAPAFVEEPSVSIPFSFEVEQPASQPFTEPTPAASAGSPFAFAFEPEAEQPASAPIAFEPPQDLDIPTAFDASAFAADPFAAAAAPEGDLPSMEEPAVETPVESMPAIDSPLIDIAPVFAMETGHELESVPFDQVSLATDAVELAQPFAVPSVPDEIYAAETPSAGSGEAQCEETPADALQQAAMPVEGLAQYLETTLPFIVQKSVDNILKQNGVVRDDAVVLSGNLAVLDICDVLRIVEASRISGKLFAFLPALSAELYFDHGKAFGASVSMYSGVKKRVVVETGSDMMRMKALLVKTVADIVETSSGAFSVEQFPVQDAASAIPFRLSSSELIQAALSEADPDAVAGRVDDRVHLVRAVDQSVIGLLSLDETERTVLNDADGQKTTAEVVAAAGGNAEARRAVYALIKLGVLREIG